MICCEKIERQSLIQKVERQPTNHFTPSTLLCQKHPLHLTWWCQSTRKQIQRSNHRQKKKQILATYSSRSSFDSMSERTNENSDQSMSSLSFGYDNAEDHSSTYNNFENESITDDDDSESTLFNNRIKSTYKSSLWEPPKVETGLQNFYWSKELRNTARE